MIIYKNFPLEWTFVTQFKDKNMLDNQTGHVQLVSIVITQK